MGTNTEVVERKLSAELSNEYHVSPEDLGAGISNEVAEFIKAILSPSPLKGFGHGIENILNILAHPLDNIVYPMIDFVHDAAVISAAHLTEDVVLGNSADTGVGIELTMLRQTIDEQPFLYFDAKNRMQQRFDNLNATQEQFRNGSWN